MKTVFSNSAILETIAATLPLTPDRRDEIETVSKAASLIFCSHFPDLFPPPVLAENPRPSSSISEDEQEFIMMIHKEFVAAHTLATVYASVNPKFAAAQSARASDLLDTLRCLGLPQTL